MKKSTVADDSSIRKSSGNVFADLGLPDSEELMVKAKLMHAVSEEIKRQGLTQAEAARLTGLDQSDISRLNRGKMDNFSRERLLDVIGKLGNDVEIVIKPGHGGIGKIRVRELVK